MTVFIAWVLYAALGTTFIVSFFLWGVRNRQFADQDRARYLPLAAEAPDEKG